MGKLKDVVVIGCGIIGATVTQALRKAGQEVICIDSKKTDAGTPPSGGHLKPSWFGGMSKADSEASMKTLDDVWGLIEEKFWLWPRISNVKTTVYRVDTDVVVQTPSMLSEVKAIDLTGSFPRIKHSSGEFLARNLIVAAGVWCRELLPDIELQCKRGVSFRFTGNVGKPTIKPWAPYKQIVSHQQNENEIWVGDGSALLDKNWTPTRTSECLDRCQTFLGPKHELVRHVTGLRPYSMHREDKSKPCLLRQVHKRCWVATGAGKMGTIAAGWVWNQIGPELHL